MFLSAVMPSPLSSQERENRKPQILLLHSYHQGYKWTDDITRGVLSILGEQADIRIEYMDTKRYMGTGGISPETYLDLLDKILKAKHDESAYSLIITADNYAFDFFNLYGRKTFPDIPVVFCGVNYLDPSLPAQDPNMTGVNENPDIAGSFSMIRKIFPDRKNLVCITDISSTGQIMYRELKAGSNIFRDRFDSITILQDIAIQDLEKTLDALDDSSVVFFTYFFHDSIGNFLEYDESTRRISEAADEVPVVGTWDFSLGEGIIGGHLVSGFEQGRMAAEQAVKALKAGDAGKVKIIWETPHTDVFDYNKLLEFNISQKRLPAGYTLINQPDTIFYTYKTELLGILVFIIILILMIALLQQTNLKLHSTQKILREERDMLDRRVEERTMELAEINDSLKTTLGRLHRTQNQLINQERQAAIGSLLSGMAHEINTPLGIAITSSTHVAHKMQNVEQDLADDSLTQEELEECLQNFDEGMALTIDNLKRAASLVDNFKTISGSGDQLILSEFNLYDYIEELIGTYRKNFSEDRITIRLSGDHLSVSSSKAIFYGILTNILMNSREHAFPREMVEDKIITITLSSDPDNDRIGLIEYRDNGVGISTEMLEVLFEPFTTTDRYSGKIGLGLHKVYKLVTEKLGGTIECTDCQNGGAEFLISFPKQTERQ